MLRFATVFVVVSASLAAAPVPKELKPPDAVAVLGVWRFAEFQIDGMAVPADKVAKMTVRFDDDKATFTAHGHTYESAKYQLDSTKKHIVFVPKELSTPRRPGVYSLDGNIFKVAVSSAEDGARPKFAMPGKGVMYYKLKLVPEEKR